MVGTVSIGSCTSAVKLCVEKDEVSYGTLTQPNCMCYSKSLDASRGADSNDIGFNTTMLDAFGK